MDVSRKMTSWAVTGGLGPGFEAERPRWKWNCRKVVPVDPNVVAGEYEGGGILPSPKRVVASRRHYRPSCYRRIEKGSYLQGSTKPESERSTSQAIKEVSIAYVLRAKMEHVIDFPRDWSFSCCWVDMQRLVIRCRKWRVNYFRPSRVVYFVTEEMYLG